MEFYASYGSTHAIRPDRRSGSMAPTLQAGDILFITNSNRPIRAGHIVAFNLMNPSTKDRNISVVHRVVRVHEKEDGKVQWLLVSVPTLLI